MKEMRTKAVQKALRDAGCTVLKTDGRHTKWGCPCGLHTAPLADSHLTVPPGTVRSIIKQLPCLPKGWIQ